MPNKKGGYKIVSLNGLDLRGGSLAIAGLYDKLANSYDKSILVSDIVISGKKKKNAFVQVEVVTGGIKINDLYGYDLLVEEDGDITVSANPQELPNITSASAGQVLTVDIVQGNKKPAWKDVPEELPSTATASQGNALLLDAEKKPVWGAISGGTKLYCHKIIFANNDSARLIFVSTRKTAYSSYSDMRTDFLDGKLSLIVEEAFTGSYSGNCNSVTGLKVLNKVQTSGEINYYKLIDDTPVAINRVVLAGNTNTISSDTVTEL